MVYESIYKEAFNIYSNVLKSEEGSHGLDYIKNRGFNEELIDKYQIGFSPKDDSGQFLTKLLVKKFNKIDILKSGLSKIDSESLSMKDSVGKQRIVFPIFGFGKPTGISARTIFDDVKPKYKSLCFERLGIYNSEILLYNPKIIYLCEGAIDCLSLLTMGLNAIGIFGVQNIGKEYYKYFEKFTGKIIISVDNDEAGKSSLNRIGSLLYSFGIKEVEYKFLEESDEKVDLNDILIKYGPNISRLKFLEIKSNILEIKKEMPKKQIEYTSYDKYNIDLYKIVSSFVGDLKQESGGRFRCSCPFHKERTPSFVVETEKNYYKCYGCGKFGGPVKFVMDILNIDYKNAIERIKQIL